MNTDTKWHEYKITDDHGKHRRWFQLGDLDLVVWINDLDEILQYQITFMDWTGHGTDTKLLQQHVLTFVLHKGLHGAVVPDETSQYPTPKILIPEAHKHFCKKIAELFDLNHDGLPEFIYKFTVMTLKKEYTSSLTG